MNTKQLIALWYTVIGLLSLLIFSEGKILPFRLSEWAAIAICVASIGLLAVYTMKTSHQLDKRTFYKWVIPALSLPFITAAILIGVITFTAPKLAEIPLGDRYLLTGQAQISPLERLEVNLYNGSTWEIKEITVQLKVTSKTSGEHVITVDRKYVLSCWVSPMTSKECNTNVGFSLRNGQDFSWNILSAVGYPRR